MAVSSATIYRYAVLLGIKPKEVDTEVIELMKNPVENYQRLKNNKAIFGVCQKITRYLRLSHNEIIGHLKDFYGIDDEGAIEFTHLQLVKYADRLGLDKKDLDVEIVKTMVSQEKTYKRLKLLKKLEPIAEAAKATMFSPEQVTEILGKCKGLEFQDVIEKLVS